ncbi:histone H1-like [Thalassophryne amazonica]|uniref:histone H1-like n=1 Tax=Thalassophryne amazonica TaxID=390379 RepID=UPI00147151C1|nr:histone H1-like [Thalassophryne amazonica]
MTTLNTAPFLVLNNTRRSAKRMAEVVPAPDVAAKAPKKKAAKKTKSGPSISDQILDILSASKDRKGTSIIAIKKALAAGGYDVDNNKGRVKVAIKSLLEKGTVVQTKGSGASGSFKLAKKATSQKTPAKSKKPTAKKPAPAKKPKLAKKPAPAKKPKKTTPKKAAGPKKSPKKTAKKTPAATKTKSPKPKKSAPKKGGLPKKKAAKPKPKKVASKKK